MPNKFHPSKVVFFLLLFVLFKNQRTMSKSLLINYFYILYWVLRNVFRKIVMKYNWNGTEIKEKFGRKFINVSYIETTINMHVGDGSEDKNTFHQYLLSIKRGFLLLLLWQFMRQTSQNCTFFGVVVLQTCWGYIFTMES